jgi:hypothetical protein
VFFQSLVRRNGEDCPHVSVIVWSQSSKASPGEDPAVELRIKGVHSSMIFLKSSSVGSVLAGVSAFG